MIKAPFRFLLRQLYARPLAVFGATLFLGVLLGSRIDVPLICSSAVCVLGVLLGIALYRSEWARLLVLGLILPFFLGIVRYDLEELRKPAIEAAYSVTYEGKVVSDVTRTDTERLVCTLQVTRIDGNACNERVRLYLRSDERPLEGIEYGQTLRLNGHIWPQPHATNPYQTDQANWLKGLGFQGMASAKLEEVEIVSAQRGWQTPFIALRRALADRIDRLFPGSAALARAFILGDKTLLDADAREAFNNTGVAHIISLSGMHVAVLAFMLQKLLGRIFRRSIADGLTLVFLALYTALTGFPPSLVRASLMFAIVVGARLYGGVSDAPTRLAAALILMLLANPYYIHSVGFLLSFAASAGIILFKEPFDRLLRRDLIPVNLKTTPTSTRLLRRVAATFFDLCTTTLAATVATLPLVIQWFGGQSLLALPLNLIAVPIAMAAYPLALLITCLSFLAPHTMTVAAMLPDKLFQTLLWVVKLFALAEFSHVHAPNYPWWLMILHTAMLLAASCVSKLKPRLRRMLAPSLLLLVFFSMGVAWVRSLGFTTVFLDAGQADATVMTIDGRVFVYDTGEPYTPVDDYVNSACLGVDAVFLSHPHYDHAGGLKSLIQAMRPKVIYVPEGWFSVEATDAVSEGMAYAQSRGIPIIELSAGDVLPLTEHAVATVYGPSEPVEDVNDMSLLLCVTRNDASVFLTGDLTSGGEPDILPDVDVLRTPHHGSSKSTSEAFLSKTSPEIAVISVGRNNYGHPSDEVLERLRLVGAKTYRTDECGAITVRYRNDDYRISTYLPHEEAGH